ncbi:hypothetical protein L484_000601 [Morus notabilis]|uniref:Uncharacterized protein n=1 Tax=Morus notabilis TaxID=981085 RepID=W9T241_9ROSA|nr:hypothetical protein L484_000601 [Morus notabilis]
MEPILWSTETRCGEIKGRGCRIFEHHFWLCGKFSGSATRGFRPFRHDSDGVGGHAWKDVGCQRHCLGGASWYKTCGTLVGLCFMSFVPRGVAIGWVKRLLGSVADSGSVWVSFAGVVVVLFLRCFWLLAILFLVVLSIALMGL